MWIADSKRTWQHGDALSQSDSLHGSQCVRILTATPAHLRELRLQVLVEHVVQRAEGRVGGNGGHHSPEQPPRPLRPHDGRQRVPGALPTRRPR